MVSETISLDGLKIARATRHEVADHILSRLAEGRGGWVITVNVDHLHRCRRDASVRAFCDEADLVVADGVPVLWAARLQGTPLPDRVAGSDLVWLIAERAARAQRSLFLLGGDPGSAELAAERLRERWPTLRIAGCASPRVSAHPTREETDDVAQALVAASPDVIWVALGAPKQERLIALLRERLPHAWWIGVGISFSFMAEQIPRAPHWMQRAGLEWLHRMAQEPRRLARRYLVDDLPYVVRLLIQSWRARGA